MPGPGASYGARELEALRAIYGETEWMVHLMGSDEVLLYSDETDEVEGETEYTEHTAHAAAAAINRVAAEARVQGDEYTSTLHATVFHRGVPAEAVEVSR